MSISCLHYAHKLYLYIYIIVAATLPLCLALRYMKDQLSCKIERAQTPIENVTIRVFATQPAAYSLRDIQCLYYTERRAIYGAVRIIRYKHIISNSRPFSGLDDVNNPIYYALSTSIYLSSCKEVWGAVISDYM